MRFSKQRELVYGVVSGRKDHPTADMIYQACRQVEPNISLGTVYRNLKLLSDEGKILTLETSDKKIHYDGDTSLHSHFICNNCGRIVDIFNHNQNHGFLSEMGLTVTGEKCFYYGNCNHCK